MRHDDLFLNIFYLYLLREVALGIDLMELLSLCLTYLKTVQSFTFCNLYENNFWWVVRRYFYANGMHLFVVAFVRPLGQSELNSALSSNKHFNFPFLAFANHPVDIVTFLSIKAALRNHS